MRSMVAPAGVAGLTICVTETSLSTPMWSRSSPASRARWISIEGPRGWRSARPYARLPTRPTQTRIASMQRRRFGRTGLEVPALTYGGGWVGGLIIRAAVEARERVLDSALAAGIDWIDTASVYGN